MLYICTRRQKKENGGNVKNREKRKRNTKTHICTHLGIHTQNMVHWIRLFSKTFFLSHTLFFLFIFRVFLDVYMLHDFNSIYSAVKYYTRMLNAGAKDYLFKEMLAKVKSSRTKDLKKYSIGGYEDVSRRYT